MCKIDLCTLVKYKAKVVGRKLTTFPRFWEQKIVQMFFAITSVQITMLKLFKVSNRTTLKMKGAFVGTIENHNGPICFISIIKFEHGSQIHSYFNWWTIVELTF